MEKSLTSDPGLEWLPSDDEGRYLQRIDVRFFSDKIYSYAWGGKETLKVGDIVVVPRPPGWIGPHLGHARVVSLRSGYEGPIRTITTLMRRD